MSARGSSGEGSSHIERFSPLDVQDLSRGRGRPLDWDAAAYEETSAPQQEWGAEVLDRLVLRGDEAVLDAGCGAGQVTERLLARLPRGRVIGFDASPSMIARARARLGDCAELVVGDLLELALSELVDAILSTATFHWVPDHPRLWRRLHSSLRPGGRLEAQYGGHGNVAAPAAAMARLAGDERFRADLGPFASPWRFPTAAEAQADAEAAGFEHVKTWLEGKEARPADMRGFLATSVVPRELAKLPAERREDYLDALLDELGHPDSIAYVRVNVSARALGADPRA